MAYQLKAWNPRNTVAATNPVFDVLRSLEVIRGRKRSLEGHTLYLLLLLYSLGSKLSFDMKKAKV